MRGKTVLIAVATALALAFLWRLLAPPAPEVVAVGADTREAAPAQVLALEYRDGVLLGAESLQVEQGSTLRLRVRSDKAAELHLHGYDRTLQLDPAAPVEMTLLADRSGRFELEVHGDEHGDGHHGGASLEVYPQGSLPAQ